MSDANEGYANEALDNSTPDTTPGTDSDSQSGNNQEQSGIYGPMGYRFGEDKDYIWFKTNYTDWGKYLDVDPTVDTTLSAKGIDESKLSTYQQKLLDERYARWRGSKKAPAASFTAFSKKEIEEFRQRDAVRGVSAYRTKADANDAIQNPTYVKFDEATGRPVGIYKNEWNFETHKWEETQVKSYDEFNNTLDKIMGTEFQGFDEWGQATGNGLQDVTQSGEWAGMSDLIQRLQSGEIPQEVLDEAIAFAGQSLGYGSGEEYTQDIASRRAGIDAGGQGLSLEERANLEQQSRLGINRQEELSSRALESIRAGGQSAAKYFMMADEQIANITNQRIQSEIMIANEDFSRRQADIQVKQKQLDTLLSSGQITQQQYISAYQNNQALALQGYASQISTMLQQNQEVFQRYSTDQQAVAANLQNMYAGLQASMGLDQFALAEAENMYYNEIAPFMIQLDIFTQDQMLAMQNKAMDIQKEANVMGLVGDIIGGIGTIFGGPVGGAIVKALT